MENIELWKDIPEYEWLYQASTFWNIRSLNFNNWSWIKNRKKQLNKWGYEYVNLSKLWVQNKLKVHRLVWLTFLENPENKRTINHRNWIHNDNRVENLEWFTDTEQQIHKYNVLWYKLSHRPIVRKNIWYDFSEFNDKTVTIEWNIIDWNLYITKII